MGGIFSPSIDGSGSGMSLFFLKPSARYDDDGDADGACLMMVTIVKQKQHNIYVASSFFFTFNGV